MNHTNDLITELKEKLVQQGNPTVLEDCTGSEDYAQSRLVFNRKFEFRPTLIVYVENAEQVSTVVKFARKHPTEIILRFRSGGHDHEGECSGTNTVVLDFSKLSTIEIQKDQIFEPTKEKYKKLIVGPGARFIKIKPKLDAAGVGIPHGTCETVAIAGFTMGGGWGPWTRLHGMACESLIGATIVLGNGEIKKLSYLDDPKSDEGRLLWALRGGGGMSYGVVTELVFKTFELPDVSFSFNIKFNQLYTIPQLDGSIKKVEEPIKMKAIEVLKLWEKAIAPDAFPSLIGTNLKVETAHLKEGERPDPNAYLKCQINGYYGGSEIELKEFVQKILGTEALKSLTFKQDRIKDAQNLGRNFSDQYTWHFESWDRHVINRIKLDPDGPAPHKITSRLVDAICEDRNDNWDDRSREALMCSLQSNKIPEDFDADMRHGVHTYITLGAISGNFYANYSQPEGSIGSSFPYKKRPFTIQYQAWWNQFLDRDDQSCLTPEEIEKEMIINRPFVNRAQDWIEDSRDYHIPHTSGAFISFKDSSIPTSTYFMENYNALIDVKVECSQDPKLLFRTRKTIL
ncbi:FAD-dependent oxidoreductase [bacterium SCSIO 12643]|nr:FAD-dependent oxidoreductase [bacterium SCSIO 12643]